MRPGPLRRPSAHCVLKVLGYLTARQSGNWALHWCLPNLSGHRASPYFHIYTLFFLMKNPLTSYGTSVSGNTLWGMLVKVTEQGKHILWRNQILAGSLGMCVRWQGPPGRGKSWPRKGARNLSTVCTQTALEPLEFSEKDKQDTCPEPRFSCLRIGNQASCVWGHRMASWEAALWESDRPAQPRVWVRTI